ncbi:hypothetical protein [Sphingobium sp. ZW T5_29]|uniref:hypothetical protein n=1 Tax=Sphingobium sp. ZW T5_29 TaxID=3378077 RepID=UPI00385459DB
MRKCLLLILALFCPLNLAHAQHPLVLQKLNERNEAAPAPGIDLLKKEVLSTAISIQDSNGTCSNSEVIIDRIHPATGDRFVFSAVLSQRMRNAWTINARLPKCDNMPARYMLMQNMDGSIRTIRVNRGVSYAWDSLIGDTLPLVRLAANVALKRKGIDCNEGSKFKLGVTRIASESQDLGSDLFGIRYIGSWSEIWPIETCSQTVEVLVNFTADGDGGAYSRMPGDKVAVLPK